jgi:2-phosphoglycerate kinase
MSSPGAPQPRRGPSIMLITGISAAGKSTVAQLLAERLPQSVDVRGDLFRRMVISGRADMTPEPTAEALRQLRLRYPRLPSGRWRFSEGVTVLVQEVIERFAQQARLRSVGRSRELR